MRELRIPAGQNSLDIQSLICFAVKLPPRILSYKPHSIPSANNLPASNLPPPHLSLQSKSQPFACDNLPSRRLRRQSQSYGFQHFAFFFYFFLFVLYFFAFSSPHFTSSILHPIYRIFIFSVFFFGFLHEKQHPFLSKSRYVSSSRFIDSHPVCSKNLTTSSKLSFLLRVKSASGFRQNIHLYFSISDIVLNNCDFICLICFFI